MSTVSIIVHGGAGDWESVDESAARAGVERAAGLGVEILLAGGSALDAAEVACSALEDEPLYDAGIGSYPNAAGEAELDAILVDAGEPGELADFGAVAGLRRLQNPIRLTRRILQERRQRIFIGAGADALAAEMGLPLIENAELITAANRKHYEDYRASEKILPSAQDRSGGTVGVVTRDARGRLAAATSTGGAKHKPPGRVGDSPIFGAGAYANAHLGAASATGDGEKILRALLTRAAVERLAQTNDDAQSAADSALKDLLCHFPKAGVGLILVDAAGRLGAAHSTFAMPRAWWAGGQIHSAFVNTGKWQHALR